MDYLGWAVAAVFLVWLALAMVIGTAYAILVILYTVSKAILDKLGYDGRG